MSESAAEAIEKILPCRCDAAYKDRGLTQPDCPRCNFADDIHEILRTARAQDAERIRESEGRVTFWTKQYTQIREAGAAELAKVDALERQLGALREVLRLPLMFYAAGPWTDAARAEWMRITDSDETTTKVMCDTIRRALAPSPPSAREEADTELSSLRIRVLEHDFTSSFDEYQALRHQMWGLKAAASLARHRAQIAKRLLRARGVDVVEPGLPSIGVFVQPKRLPENRGGSPAC